MKLSKIELSEYLQPHLKLLFFCYSEMKSLKKTLDFEEFKKQPLQTKFEARNYFNNNGYLLDKYISNNKNELTTDEIIILQGFKKKITGDFVLFKALKSYTIFIDTNNNIYGVHSLSDPLNEMLLMPVLANMTILPFRDKIIYDGFINSYNMYIGSNMRSDYKDLLNKKRKEGTILTALD